MNRSRRIVPHCRLCRLFAHLSVDSLARLHLLRFSFLLPSFFLLSSHHFHPSPPSSITTFFHHHFLYHHLLSYQLSRSTSEPASGHQVLYGVDVSAFFPPVLHRSDYPSLARLTHNLQAFTTINGWKVVIL